MKLFRQNSSPAPSLWGMEINNQDHLVSGGCDVVELAKTYATPLHVVDEDKLRANYHKFYNTFQRFYPSVEVFYSYKTNCVAGVLKILHEEGAGAEVISPYELWLALQLSVPPDKILYNGVNKSQESLRIAIKQGIKAVHIDSWNELYHLQDLTKELGKTLNVGIRVRPSVGWRWQFGFDLSNGEALQAYGALSQMNHLRPEGVHFHIGSNLKKPELYTRAIWQVCRLMKELKDRSGLELNYVDIGGGIGIPGVKTFTLFERGLYYLWDRLPQVPKESDDLSLETFARTIGNTLLKGCEYYHVPSPTLLLEPGRALSGDAQILLVTVGSLKQDGKGRSLALTDGGSANIAFPVSFEYHEVFVANKARMRSEIPYRITGQVCTPSDILYRRKKLASLEEGDILAVMDTGAYFTSFANNFAFPRPAIVSVSRGQARIVRKRESFEKLTACESF
jgi:diaminopimelate decarboxylase